MKCSWATNLEAPPAASKTSKLDAFKPYLNQQLAAGVRNATRLFAEIAQLGYTGSYPILERYLQPLRRADAATLAHAVRTRPPPVRQVTAWIMGLPGRLDRVDHARLQAIRGRCPEIDTAVRHVAGFARMIKDLSGDEQKLTAWTGIPSPLRQRPRVLPLLTREQPLQIRQRMLTRL